MGTDQVRRRLERAANDDRFVRVTRKGSWDRLDGTVQAVGTTWLVMALDRDAGFDGHAVVRVADVRRVTRQTNVDFVRRAYALEGRWPPPRLDGVDLSSTRGVVETLSTISPLLSVFYEREHADECQIGVVDRLRNKKFRLQLVSPNAVWEDDTVFRYRSVSRVGVGGAYGRRLDAVAGPPPR